LARWGRIISLQCRSWPICQSPHNAVIYMSTLRLASRAVWCRSWVIFVGGIQKTRIRSVVGQVPQASLCRQGLIIHVERLPFQSESKQHYSEWFETKTAVRQGDPLSALLFIVSVGFSNHQYRSPRKYNY